MTDRDSLGEVTMRERNDKQKGHTQMRELKVKEDSGNVTNNVKKKGDRRQLHRDLHERKYTSIVDSFKDNQSTGTHNCCRGVEVWSACPPPHPAAEYNKHETWPITGRNKYGIDWWWVRQ